MNIGFIEGKTQVTANYFHGTKCSHSELICLSKAARGRPEGPTERSVFKIIFVMLAVLWLTFLGDKRNENVT